MNKLPRNVWILTIAQALMMSVNSLVVFVGGIVGAKIAPVEKLATLPVACGVIGTAVVVVPVTALMKRTGRRRSFILIAAYSVIVALLAGYSIHIHSFYLLCFCTFLFGVTSACVMQFRFAAMESVKVEHIPKAASSVLLGGIAAAFIGPETALLGKDLFQVEYAGSFVLLSVLFTIALLIIRNFRNPEIKESKYDVNPRSLGVISKQRVFWVAISSAAVGYTVMSFIMTATPVSMHVLDGHALHNTKWVIQSHIVAMFLPSLVTARIIDKIGLKNLMITGITAYLVCIGIAFSGHQLGNYWVSLILLGIGWNFLFIGGTTLLPQSYRPEERFKVQAINEFLVFGTQAVASLSAGWFVFAMGWEAILLSTLPVILFQLLIVFKWKYARGSLGN